MARSERVIAASPEAVFDVLADPRGYAYWVIGSMEVRGASPDWPRAGSRFDHTIGVGPLRIKDHTVVEEVQPGRFLQLAAKARPLGNARVKLELGPAAGGTRITMIEDPADKLTAFVFQPLTHLLTRARNVRSLDRLAELAEGRRPIPGEEPGAPARFPDEPASVENPKMRERHAAWRGTARAARDGALAGLVGAAAMSVSTNAEMRLRRRPPSEAPAKALARVLRISPRGRRRKQMLAAGGHVGTATSLGVARGLLDRFEPDSRTAGVALFALAVTPDAAVVPALGASRPPWKWTPAEAAVSVLHHAVFAAATNAGYSRLRARR
jgi:uncharacterized protein YndB with AHSA1/START domain